jgi:hypothetical protein
VAVSAGLFAAVFALRLLVAGSEDAITVLYVLPVSLLALAFGLRAGLVAGAAAVGLVALWAAAGDVSLSALGWSSRVVPPLLLGALVGTASDRIQEAERRERDLAAVLALQRESAEINDTVVQGLAAAKWLLELGRVDEGLEVVTKTMVETQALVSELLGSASPLPGDLRRSRPVHH